MNSFYRFQIVYHNYAFRVTKNRYDHFVNRLCMLELPLVVENQSFSTVFCESLIQVRSDELKFNFELLICGGKPKAYGD